MSETGTFDREHVFMKRALELAAENAASGRGGPFAALVVKENVIVSEGTNLVTATNDPTAHAEVVAIRRACAALGTFQLTGCELYTSCEPCPMCLGAIYWSRPSVIYYCGTHKDAAEAGFDDSFIYQQTRLPVEQRHIPMRRLLPGDADRPFEAWRHNTARVRY
jgi:guanine deaminase